jgi:anaerobic selenocysteine-containing dehydrogenase
MADNNITHIEGDPDSPVNKGALCAKGLASLEYLNHPHRLKYPLRRKGERGGGEWVQISWDEALDAVAEAFTKAKAEYGPESLVFMRGSFKGGYQGTLLGRFANALGAPNIASMASVCYVPRVYGSVFTHGYNPVADYEYPPACIVVWGANLADTRIGEHRQTVRVLQKGSKLIVIDPRKIGLSDKADIWLQPRPGSDLALALGMINVIINEHLYDEQFVSNWTVGFDELKTHVQDYPPEAVEQLSWVAASTIKQAARLYASNKPAIIQIGNAIDHTMNNFQTARAISILRAITGNLGVPGGELFCSPPGIRLPMGSPELELREKISDEQRAKRLNAKDGLLPTIFYSLPQSIVKAILHGKPYPIRAGFIQGGNMLLTYSNAQQTYNALQKLDFLVVADMFMTPTAGLADIVLPVATYLEFDSIVAPPYYPVAQVQQKVGQVGECRSDFEILRDLAQRLGFGEYFWESEQKGLDYILGPAGLSFEEFRNIAVLQGHKEYRKHEKDGFKTPSGKVELYSSKLKEWGFDPLPTYHELPETPLSAPELVKQYPLVFTSWKEGVFRHSSGRQINSLRDTHPEPVVWLHPDTAGKQGIADGDSVYIETKRGRIRQKALLTKDIDPRVVGVDYAWWFPENGPDNMYGWAEANLNVLTDDSPPYGREMGTANLRGILCKIQKA